ALERLKTFLEARGVTISIVALTGALGANASAAPAAATIQSVASKAMSSHLAGGSRLVSGGLATFAVALGCLLLLFLGGFVVSRYKKSQREGGDVVAIAAANQTAVAQRQSNNAAAETTGAGVAAITQAAPQTRTVSDGNALVLRVLNRVDNKPISGATVRASTATSPRPTGVINEGDLAFDTDAE